MAEELDQRETHQRQAGEQDDDGSGWGAQNTNTSDATPMTAARATFLFWWTHLTP